MGTNKDIYEIRVQTEDEECIIDGLGDEIKTIKYDKRLNAWVVKTANHDYIFNSNSVKRIDVEYYEDY